MVTPEVGAAEIVRESGAGLVVAGEQESLSSAIRLLIADLSLARSMGDAGKRDAARFSWDHVAMQLEELYKSLKHPVHAFGADALAAAELIIGSWRYRRGYIDGDAREEGRFRNGRARAECRLLQWSAAR